MDDQDRAHTLARIAELKHELRILEATVSGSTQGGRARALLASRAALARYFDPALFADPALDILLFLFAEGEEGRPANSTICCAATRAPRTTALRYIRILTTRGLAIESDDPFDRRMTLLRLSDPARDAMRRWLEELPPADPAS